MHGQRRSINKPKIVIPIPVKKPIGAGDVVKKVTRALRIPSCQPCEARRRRLNKWVGFGRRG